eukprot:3263829-Prymnesium_polylepis.2
MRYTQAVIRGRANVGQQLMHHYTSRGIDQNDPHAVRNSICEYLDEQANVRRICSPSQGQTTHTPPLTLPDMNLLKAFINQSLVSHATDPKKHNARSQPRPQRPPRGPWNKLNVKPCHHCGGPHWNPDCTSPNAGTFAFKIKHAKQLTRNALGPRNAPDRDATALIAAAFADFDTNAAQLPATNTPYAPAEATSLVTVTTPRAHTSSNASIPIRPRATPLTHTAHQRSRPRSHRSHRCSVHTLQQQLATPCARHSHLVSHRRNSTRRATANATHIYCQRHNHATMVPPTPPATSPPPAPERPHAHATLTSAPHATHTTATAPTTPFSLTICQDCTDE